MRRGILLLACVVAAIAGSALAQVPAVVSGPRPAARVVDETGRLAAEERGEIARLAEAIHATTRADLVVVVIPTTAGAPTRRFATDLFNRWQLGHAARNDGILLFVALDDRRSEIILGDGLDTPATRAAAQRIMDGTMIPLFRQGRPGRAVLEGAKGAVTGIVGVSPEEAAPPDLPPVPAAVPGEAVERRAEPILEPLMVDAPAPEPSASLEGAGDADPPAGGPGGAAPKRAAAVEDAPAPRVWQPLPAAGGHGQVARGAGGEPIAGMVMLLLLGGGVTAAGTWMLRSLWRRRYRDCPDCDTPMIRLGELEEDARLEPAEKCEEHVGSADYRVWTCPACPAAEKVRYGRFFTRYAKCPRCRAVTKSTTVSRIRSATTYREGLERIDERCLHCGWEKTSERVISRIPESSSIDWSVGSGSSGGGFSGGGSSGGGFSGGGHSSGGGASGSW